MRRREFIKEKRKKIAALIAREAAKNEAAHELVTGRPLDPEVAKAAAIRAGRRGMAVKPKRPPLTPKQRFWAVVNLALIVALAAWLLHR